MLQQASLSDRTDLSVSPVLLSGVQALIRLMLMQRARDAAAGHDTAGYITGYRGSPLGGLDLAVGKAARELGAAQVRFQPGMNEDLAATALWGTQMAGLRGEGRHAGVFGLWYGKGPGVDRSGDVFRHANMAGTDPRGGVLLALGDDHTGESSTTLHQSDYAMVDAQMPLLSPAGVQEILDFGLYGLALSRFSGLWAGLKLMKDTVETTAIVDGRPERMQLVAPQFEMPEGGLNIRLVDTPHAQEERLERFKLPAALAFAGANGIDRVGWRAPGARIGLVAAGKNWLDLVHALDLLGIKEAEAGRLGITTLKIGQTWPLATEGVKAWAEGLDLILVVEEKRKLIEGQIKEALFGWPLRVQGGRRDGAELFPARMALDPVTVARRLGEIFIAEGRGGGALQARLTALAEAPGANEPDAVARLPYFCAGCPHNTSTVLPTGARAYAGIGCHYMVQWMDRETLGFTQMGGEGANWVGEAPFSKRDHIFQNIGDGTFNHSGLMAIRFAVISGVNMTYKVLYNDAVAMTGGQTNDGGMTAAQVCAELLAAGVKTVALVYDEKEEIDFDSLPREVTRHQRDDLEAEQERLSRIKGVTAIVYVQTCAAEKRRRRRRGIIEEPAKRLWINPDICEGCGDCGVQSNCVALVPVETEFGRKRAIDHSACNKDYSCLKGFCPSFVTYEMAEGAAPQRAPTPLEIPDLPPPQSAAIDGTFNIVITGIGGTGAVTLGAVIAMAGRLAGKGAAMMEMAGLAQKGGAVSIHCRLAEAPEDISAIRIALGEADTVIGGDLVATAAAGQQALMRRGRTRAAVNTHQTLTGAFTRDTEFRLPSEHLRLALEARLGEGLTLADTTRLAEALMGDSIYGNVLLLGLAWQKGLLPLPLEAMEAAFRLNGTAAEANLRAFALGRWAALEPGRLAELAAPKAAEPSLAERIAQRRAHLLAYQNEALARRFDALLAQAPDDALRAALAEGYHKLLTYKDEYEVARLHLSSAARAAEALGPGGRVQYHLAPPLIARKGSDGRPKKVTFGPWMGPVFGLLARLKPLRGTVFDPFGHSADRRLERELIAEYEADMTAALAALSPANRDAVLARARLPLQIRGFGPVKAASAEKAQAERARLMTQIRTAPALAAE